MIMIIFWTDSVGMGSYNCRTMRTGILTDDRGKFASIDCNSPRLFGVGMPMPHFMQSGALGMPSSTGPAKSPMRWTSASGCKRWRFKDNTKGYTGLRPRQVKAFRELPAPNGFSKCVLRCWPSPPSVLSRSVQMKK